MTRRPEFTEMQSTALLFPCYRSQDTIHPTYAAVDDFGIVLLTIDLYPERQIYPWAGRPVWHVACSHMDRDDQRVPKASWSPDIETVARLRAGVQLRGIGRLERWTEEAEYTIHMRAHLSDEEILLLPRLNEARGIIQ